MGSGYAHAVRNRARKLTEGYFRVGGKGGANDRGDEGAKKDDGGASVHVCVARGVVSDIDSLCQGALGEHVVYRGFLAGQEGCSLQMD